MNIQENIQVSEAQARATEKSSHPFAKAFTNLSGHKPEDALAVLTRAIHAEQRDDNAYDWVQEALPGAVLKVGYAYGTLGELYKTFTRDQEFIRFTSTLQDRRH